MSKSTRPGFPRAEAAGQELPFNSARPITEQGLGSKPRRPRRETIQGYKFRNPLPEGMEAEVSNILSENSDGSINSGVLAENDRNRFEIDLGQASGLDNNTLSPYERLDQDGDEDQTVVINAPAIDKNAPDSGLKPVTVTFNKK